MSHHTTNRPALPAHCARRIWCHDSDPLTHAALGLLLLAGLRPAEVEAATVRDYAPDGPRLRVGGQHCPRSIALAPSAATALDGYLATRNAGPEEPLLPTAGTPRLVLLVRAAARAAGVEAGVHDLRHAAIAAAIEDGTPVGHINAYFGIGVRFPAAAPGLRDGWDTGVARGLEAAFAAV